MLRRPSTGRAAGAFAAVAALLSLAGCSTDNDDTAATSSSAITLPETIAIDTESVLRDLPVTAGNVVTTVNNARGQNFTPTPGYESSEDVAQYYDDMTAVCKTRIRRSAFRADFLARVVPMIDDAQPERVTAQVDGNTATAYVEQTSGRTLAMRFDVEPINSAEHACNPDGTIAISISATTPPSSAAAPSPTQ
ncbi:hypothetical protein [Gordonia sp. NPDC003585]|uniref:hypothetical protein n=1 Tax=Gordonia sp. NPDC003585 TaxID=3154275 RepID=UPI0033BAFE7E